MAGTEKLPKTSVSADLDADHVISVKMDDLTKEEQEAIEREVQLEAEQARERRLACYRKARNGNVKKIHEFGGSSGKVISPSMSPEEFTQFLDVSIASKYGADLGHLTHELGESMRSVLGGFKQDLDNSLPRQVRTVAQEVNEALGRHVANTNPLPGHTATGGVAQGGNAGTNVVNPNLP